MTKDGATFVAPRDITTDAIVSIEWPPTVREQKQ